jgi:Right handed beta helix region
MMIRSLLALARALPPLRSRLASRHAVAAGLAGVVTVAALIAERSPAAAAATCDRSATPTSFSSQVSAATAGQTICLASGDYGTWTGTNKAVTITAASGNTPTMQVSFGSADSGFTLNGISGMGGMISGSASTITIQNSTFASQLDIEGAVTNIVVNHNDFTYPVQSTSGGPNAKIFLATTGSSPGSALTLENNDIENGDLDGVHVGDGSGVLVYGNKFANLCDRGVNHTDNIQFEAGTQITIASNYVYEAQNCATQGITSYDGGTNGLIIEDNVVDVPRDWGIELYADKNSVVVHNTVVYHPKSYSEFHTATGHIDIDRKSQDPAGSGTQVYDNITTSVDFTNGSTGTQHNNVSGERAIYVGPTDTWTGFKLASNSLVGLHAASDGLDDGARISTAPPPTPSPTPTPGQTPSRRAPTHGPTITGFSFSPSRFAAARAGAKSGPHVRRGTSIRYHLSVPARARIAIARALSGRSSGGRCVRPTRSLRKHRACTRYIFGGALTRTGKAGRNTLAFSGTLRGRRLKRGRYRATIVATDREHRRSRPRTATFTVT